MDRRPDKETISALKNHIRFLKKSFKPERIILFGSRARGDHLKESDYDLLVISNKFQNINFRERISQAYGLWDKKQNLDIICYTVEEFERMKKRIGIVQQAAREGIEVS